MSSRTSTTLAVTVLVFVSIALWSSSSPGFTNYRNRTDGGSKTPTRSWAVQQRSHPASAVNVGLPSARASTPAGQGELVCTELNRALLPVCQPGTVELVPATATHAQQRVVNVSTYGASTPLITAVCVSHSRPDMLHRAVYLWAAQTYENLELVIVFDDWDAETKAVANLAAAKFPSEGHTARPLPRRRVTLVINHNRTVKLGPLRNSAIAAARGQYVIQWDDDDVHMPQRIAHSLAALRCSGKRAIMLDSWLMIHYETKKGTSYHGRFYVAPRGLQPGSVLADRTLLLDCYPDITRGVIDTEVGEDSICADKLVAAGDVAAMHSPLLYLYINHGNNACSYKHFKWLSQRSSREKQLRFNSTKMTEMESLVRNITGRRHTDKAVNGGIVALSRFISKSWMLQACVNPRS
jgi:glycosyltransferase involved in cell wall biosynthesis